MRKASARKSRQPCAANWTAMAFLISAACRERGCGIVRETKSPREIALSTYSRLRSSHARDFAPPLGGASGDAFDSAENDTSKNERYSIPQSLRRASVVPYLRSRNFATSRGSWLHERWRVGVSASARMNFAARVFFSSKIFFSSSPSSSRMAKAFTAVRSSATLCHVVHDSGASGYTSRGNVGKRVETYLAKRSERSKNPITTGLWR